MEPEDGIEDLDDRTAIRFKTHILYNEEMKVRLQNKPDWNYYMQALQKWERKKERERAQETECRRQKIEEQFEYHDNMQIKP